MGILLSRVRKKKTAIETLEKLDSDIKEIEENHMNAQRKYKRITKLLLVYSLGLYIVCGIIFYYQYTSTLKGKLLYLVPLALSPLILYFVKIIISWYYVRLLNKNQIRLNEMKKEKKRILEEVMDKETYKVAKEILEKYSPPDVSSRANNSLMTVAKPDDGLRKRVVKGTSSFTSTSVRTPGNMARDGNETPKIFRPNSSSLKPFPAPVGPMLRLPAPILPLERSYVDKVIEYLIGDGVNNRYALICSQCHSHNGMALKEEFEYISYKCCYCYFFNPARKIKPEAPKLESSLRSRRASDTESDKTSGENSDTENKISADETSAETKILDADNDVHSNNLESRETDMVMDKETSSAVTETEITEQPAVEEISSSQPENDADCDELLPKSQSLKL